MGFFYLKKVKKSEVEFLRTCHDGGCVACTLHKEWSGLQHPDMPAHGNKNPLIYMLGEAPGAEEDQQGIPFVGRAGQALRMRIPFQWEKKLRWNNCVRTRPPNNRQPSRLELECCRMSIVRDIEQTKPKAIFGFGNIPLTWALEQTHITNWAGRMTPVKIGTHTCWFFPFLHPSYVARTRRFEPRDASEYGSDIEFSFAFDLRKAFDMVEAGLPPPIIHSDEQISADVEIVTGEKGLYDLTRVITFMRAAMKEPFVGFDFETAGTRPYNQSSALLTVAIARKDKAMAIALSHPDAGWNAHQLEMVTKWLRALLTHEKCRKVVHNSAFEMEWTAFFINRKCLWQSKWEDTMAQAFILDERQGCLSLDFLCQQYFGIKLKAFSNLDQANLAKVPLPDVLQYNAIDAKYHRLLYKKQRDRINAEGLQQVYNHHMQRIPACVLTQLKGVPVDQSVTKSFHKRYTRRIALLEEKIAAMTCVKNYERKYRQKFRPSALHDLGRLLNDLGFEFKTLDEKALSKINHPICKRILRWRMYHKLLSTYVLPYMQGSEVLFPDNLLHPMLLTTKTRTWRTSSKDPNIQNQPVREHKEMRAQVRPGNDRQIIAFDYAGIQARNVAMESRDPALVKAFWERYDIHKDWMEKIEKVSPGWIPKGADKDTLRAYRNRAKNEMVFPSFFGAQPKSLAGYLGIDERRAERLHEQFWHMFPDIKAWHNKIKRNYYKYGYVTGLSGFRRRAPISPNEIINSPIQADESMIVMDAMIYLSQTGDPRFQPALMVHDDLTFIWPKHEIEKNAEVVIAAMLNSPFPWINVPLGVEMKVGDDWASIKEVGAYYSDEWYGSDPNAGAWADGTGWANHLGMEKAKG